ncbi:hypothetical protein BFJ63_vAg19491 [Fusarium oxysporum f. sp. narcissi]|nr:hypothetical protein BFJ63_vAg19491 [Fusarium oxysporum f. sp. narcissi]
MLIETSGDLLKKGRKTTSTETKKELWESAALILAEWETHLNPQWRLAWLDQSCNVFKHLMKLFHAQGQKSEASTYARIIVDLGMSDTILDQPTLWDCAHILKDNGDHHLAMLVAMRLLSMTHDERVIELVQDVRTHVSEMGIWAAAKASKAWRQRANRRQAIDDIPHYIETAEDAFCAICRDALRGSATRLGCSHTFHIVCAQAWLIVKPTCPECRFPVFDS